jgi:hypothetical protein
MNFEKLDKARIAAALAAAIFTGGAALYGVYRNARQDTAASYETLAPEINDLKGDVEQLRSENRRLREALARGTGVRVPEPEPAAEGERTVPTEGRTPARRPRRAATAAKTAGAPDAGAPTAQAPTPPAQPPPAEQPPPPAQPPPAEEDDPIAGLKKRVPIDFDKAVKVWKDVQEIRKNVPQQPK